MKLWIVKTNQAGASKNQWANSAVEAMKRVNGTSAREATQAEIDREVGAATDLAANIDAAENCGDTKTGTDTEL